MGADRKGKGRNVKNDKTSQERSAMPVCLLRALKVLAALAVLVLAATVATLVAGR